MGLIDMFNASNSELIKTGTKENQFPRTRSGALSTSQLHSQGNNTEELNPSTSNQKDAVNLKFKTSAGHSQFDLDGATPSTRPGANPGSQLHAQNVNPTTMKADHSIHDLNGDTPGKYLDNPPA